ncbi:MAG: bifunctional phosphoribosyl-AMP cyclohydrolase/phosphoribosyl-ATP diphosphatase HisIE [Bacteroidetes bacterium]|nr:bifunctional phosphoribosyl-AMP cyclohydrolase/phosphoribosyl-ATP diphosphatase HisIE [Bacteroidota bacterium]
MNTNISIKGLIPAIIQDSQTRSVLMLGYMNQEALQKTKETGLVTFFSRSKNRLWVKGESSGNFLRVESIAADCDEDTLLIQAKPTGPVCHTGQSTCFGDNNPVDFLDELQATIASRKKQPVQDSYISGLFAAGINKIAQKVGEEAVEVVIEAKDQNDALFLSEAADLLFHYLILLSAKDKTLDDVVAELKNRSR